MYQTIEAEVDSQGNIKLLEQVNLAHTKRALVILLDVQEEKQNVTALMSESVLAKDWDKEEEDNAWAEYQ